MYRTRVLAHHFRGSCLGILSALGFGARISAIAVQPAAQPAALAQERADQPTRNDAGGRPLGPKKRTQPSKEPLGLRDPLPAFCGNIFNYESTSTEQSTSTIFEFQNVFRLRLSSASFLSFSSSSYQDRARVRAKQRDGLVSMWPDVAVFVASPVVGLLKKFTIWAP